MSQPEIRVVGSEPSGPHPDPPPSRRWLLAAGLGVAVGLAAGILAVGGGDPDPPPSTTAAADIAAPAPLPTSPPVTAGPRLATRVPGLIDSVAAVTVDPVGDLDLTAWRPAATSPQPIDGVKVRQLDADRSHTWLSGIGPARTGGDVLWIGDEAGLEPQAVGITDAVWHAFLPGRIAWVAEDGGTRRLMILDLTSGGAPTPVTELPTALRPVWWNQAGIVLRDDASRELTLVGIDGSRLSTHPPVPRFVGGGPRIGILVEGDGQVLVDETLRVSTPAPWDLACGQPAFSPVADETVAITCASRADRRQQLQVWQLGGAEPAMVASFGASGMLPPTWTPDGRFVVIPLADPVRTSTELVFLEPATGETQRVGYPGRAVDVETTLSRLTP